MFRNGQADFQSVMSKVQGKSFFRTARRSAVFRAAYGKGANNVEAWAAS